MSDTTGWIERQLAAGRETALPGEVAAAKVIAGEPSATTVWRWCKRGQLPAKRLGNQWHVLLRRWRRELEGEMEEA